MRAFLVSQLGRTARQQGRPKRIQAIRATLASATHDHTAAQRRAAEYEALFQHCAAAVQHGGSGTTHASVRAGLPTLICSVLADNSYWGARSSKNWAQATPLPSSI